MESLGITIKVGEDRDLAQKVYSLLEPIGFKKYTSYYPTKSSPWVYTNNNGNIMHCSFKADNDIEITLPQLRDLVVLKRNNAVDKNIKDNTFHDLYQDSKGIVYFYHHGKAKWIESKINGNEKYMSNLKPITKEEGMREYLEKQEDGSYKLVMRGDACKSDDIEVPEGAVKAYLNNSNTINFVNIDDDYMNSQTNGRWINNHRGQHEACGHVLVWQRKETLNDKVASAETARQADKVLKEILEGGGSAWDTQVGGDHYKKYKIQPMEFALKNNLNPLQHSVLKYVMRHEDKNGKQDLEKAKHYIDLMIEYYYGDS